MSSSTSSSPCGACKFLRRKCVRGCVFAPHFCYEQAASHFAAIHKVFGASNASKILSHLPPADRCEAAVTISYEAQARLQDPVYGCVSHIFALQQQVVSLQAQLASLKEQQVMSNNNITSYPPDEDFQENGKNSSFNDFVGANMPYRGTGSCMDIYDTNPNPSAKYENSCFPEDNTSFGSMESLEMQYSNEHENGIWSFQDDLQSVAFGYTCNNHSSS